jgi:hypothetical protein
VLCDGVTVSVPETLYVTLVDEDGDCPSLDGITFALVHYPPYDGSGTYGSSTKHWYPAAWDGSVIVPQLPCDTVPKLTQWIAIGCDGAGPTYGLTIHGVISSGASNLYGLTLTEAELSASPLLVEAVGVIAIDEFECCSTYPANVRVIISDTPP